MIKHTLKNLRSEHRKILKPFINIMHEKRRWWLEVSEEGTGFYMIGTFVMKELIDRSFFWGGVDFWYDQD